MNTRLVKIPCPTCKKIFLPKSERNKYCKRSCFKKAYWHRMKGEEINSHNKFPTFLCPNCGQKITLDFDPVKKSSLWLKYQCPGCNTLMINVCEIILTQDISTC